MNISFRLHDKAARALGKALYTGLAVWMLGAVCSPAHAATTVAVDQQPLIIQQPLPPNITLMLDDSGSMGWDYMPDRNYLASTTDDGYRDSANNGVYFNPTITYAPPPRADGTSYPVQTHVTAAFVDGFATTPNAVDVTRYSNTFPFYTAFSFTQTSTYDATFGPVTTTTYTCPDGYSLYQGDRCRENSWPHYKIDATATPTTVDVWYCQQGDVLDATTNICTATTITQRYYFTYTTGAAAGPYTQHYVGKAGDCTALPALPAASQAVCDDSAATRQNVANWFSYYHTRILMAKSGLMNAFTTIDPTFRIGFGSINGNNDSHLPSPKATFGSNGNAIAEVAPFGDGSALTQKASFWNWVAGESVGSSTPLRASLDAVGRYYQDPQPWSTMTTDPNYSANAGTELACRQSYTILTTDGFWNGPTPSSVGNEDGTNGTKVTGPNGQSYTYTAALPYKDANSDTLADVAMKYWETDLRTTTANEVSTSTEDPAFWQHMTTFTLGLGFTPTGIAPSGTTMEQIFNWANGGAAISGFSWPTPTSANGGSINNIADLAHAAVDGHGGFYSASTPQAFASGLTDALKRATERVGTGASLAANSTKLTTGTVAYQANYYTSKWKGDLKALAIDPATGTIATTPSWSAASALPAFGSRNIKTYNPVSNATVAFTAAQLSSLSTAEQSALGTSATAQAAMINYLRGDASQEEKNSGAYRNRDTPLGDVVDSQPVYVGAPDPNQFIGESFAGSSTFAAWANNKLSRAQVVLMAANDGMLHAVNAGTGAETFAYLPAAVITSGLSALANPSYGVTTAVPHQYFNDGELTVADVYFTASTDWHTVAVGTTGRGTARAIYALDVTDPANITLLWERSAGDGKTNSNYIGQMTGKPVISQTSDGTWSVLMGNGYNSSAGVAALLQFNVTDGTLYVHPV
ncbi:MAG: PilC/PilY family type IV pilus protein, partial [Rhodanobacter sp.]|nr:PilC/PilY family type IV pilus protein [Rhodanobacter sp.]